MTLWAYLAKSGSTGVVKSVGSALIVVTFVPLIIRNIGIDNYGIWMLIAISMGIASTADFGVSRSLVYLLPKQTTGVDTNEVYSAALLLNRVMVLVITVVGGVYYSFGDHSWSMTTAITGSTGPILVICSTIVGCSSLATSLCRAVLEAHQKIHYVNTGFLIVTVANYVSVYALSFHTTDVGHYLKATAAVYAIAFVGHMATMRFVTGIRWQTPRSSVIMTVIRRAFGFYIVGATFTLADSINRYLFIFLGAPPAAYGLYDVGLKLAQMGLSCLSAFGMPLFSVFAGFGRERMGEIKGIIDCLLTPMGAAYVIGCLLFAVFGTSIMHLLVGEDSSDAFQAALPLVIGITLFGVASPSYCARLALGDLGDAFGINLLQPLVNIAAFFLFLQFTPLNRIAMSFSLSWGIVALAHIVLFRVRALHHGQ